ncbi:phage tail tape measure protein [Glutamicibacter halophytocola]|uniref:phage tail tape measure protein n=1 Tax=Glutamicibacter halophytocola TaxID=1933880 RepID=UPI0015C5470B|nr:phage tail tape measure protein [Glutamicibacter halophytocola]NQD39964.1 phage tail tape measure protein [Glutamicibacter halophytocola]
MASKINIVISAQDKASAPIRQVKNATEEASGSSSRFKTAMAGIAPVAFKTTAALTAAATAGTAFAVKSAADYEQSLNVFQSVSDATEQQMKQVAATSRELGNDMTLPGVSASDAALAMVELAKAGVSVNDTLSASKGVLSLAKAGQLETAAAAEITANALNAFNLKGKEATRIADLMAAAANASSADVTDLAYSLSMSSASAASVKVPVQDLTTAIAEMANNGIKGSDAGTSLKTMFMNLTPTTKSAAASFKELNLDFYNSKGQFVGLRDMVRQLELGTKDLTDEQKALHIENIFGADSSRAVNILLKEGVKGYDSMSKAVNKQGEAAKLAAAQNAGFKGALDGLQSSLETVATDVGMAMLPKLTDLVKFLAENVEPAFDKAKEVAKNWGAGLSDVGKQIGDYLSPKLGDLWRVITNDLAPALGKFWKEVLEPLVPVIGVTLVGALGLAIDLFKIALQVISPLISFLGDNTYIVWGAVGAFAAFKAALGISKGVAAFKAGIDIMKGAGGLAGLMTKFKGATALIGGPITMPAIAVGAALGAIAAVMNAYNKMKSAVQDAESTWQEYDSWSSGEMARRKKILYDPKSSKKEKDAARRVIRQLASHASGTNAAPGGRTLVGEHGPEVVDLPTGSRVTPAYRSRTENTVQGGHTVIIQTLNVNNGGDYNRMLSDIGFALETAS